MSQHPNAEKSEELSEQPRQPAEPPEDDRTEIGGRDGPDPTRYGDWEKNGRCIDF